VCEYRDVDVSMTKKPCNKTYSRLVKVWKPNCGGRPNNWCIGYEKRSVVTRLLSHFLLILLLINSDIVYNLWIFLAISGCNTILYHSQGGATELSLCDPEREFSICILT